MAHIEKIMREGTGADRQLAVWERTHDLKAVVDHIVTETYEGLNVLPVRERRQGRCLAVCALPRR